MGRALLPMLMILPLRRAIIPGKTAREQSITPRRLMSKVRHHCSTSVSQNGPMGPGIAALLISKLTQPKVRSISVIALRTAAASVTSVINGRARPPDCSIVRAVSSISEAERARIAVVIPAALSVAAMARPMPRPPPVTTATCPASSELVGVALELIGITGLGSALQSMDSHLPLYRGDKLF